MATRVRSDRHPVTTVLAYIVAAVAIVMVTWALGYVAHALMLVFLSGWDALR
jgi:hypothetical protein